MMKDDFFQPNSGWYYAFQITLGIYAVASFPYLVLMENNTTVDTWFNTLPGGTYFTLRYVSLSWTLNMLGAFRFFMYPSVSFALLFRRSRGCSVFWFVITLLMAGVDLFVFMGLSQLYGSCNQVRYNPCNDLNWCCVPEIFMSSVNGCLNSVTCSGPGVYPTTRAQLGINADFLWMYFVTLGFVLFDLFFVFALAAKSFVWATNRKVVRVPPPPAKDDDTLLAPVANRAPPPAKMTKGA
jgi:hypothetical protein